METDLVSSHPALPVRINWALSYLRYREAAPKELFKNNLAVFLRLRFRLQRPNVEKTQYLSLKRERSPVSRTAKLFLDSSLAALKNDCTVWVPPQQDTECAFILFRLGTQVVTRIASTGSMRAAKTAGYNAPINVMLTPTTIVYAPVVVRSIHGKYFNTLRP